jgi:hypothetical protein
VRKNQFFFLLAMKHLFLVLSFFIPFLLPVGYLYLTINTCDTLPFLIFLVSEVNSYLEWDLPFDYTIPIRKFRDENCPYVVRNVSFSYDEETVKKCMNADCLDVYNNVSDHPFFWCAVRLSSSTSCPMTMFQLDEKAYLVDPRFAGVGKNSLAMEILTSDVQEGLLLMTPRKYFTPFHSAATVTHHLLLRGRKVWCFLHSQARSILQINGYTDVPMYSTLPIEQLYTRQPFQCVEQEPGTIIYLPPFVYHMVYSYENTIALTTHFTENVFHALQSYFFDRFYTFSKPMIRISDSHRQSQLETFEQLYKEKIIKL